MVSAWQRVELTYGIVLARMQTLGTVAVVQRFLSTSLVGFAAAEPRREESCGDCLVLECPSELAEPLSCLTNARALCGSGTGGHLTKQTGIDECWLGYWRMPRGREMGKLKSPILNQIR